MEGDKKILFFEMSFFFKIIEFDEFCNLFEPENDKFSADICTPELLLWDIFILFIIDFDKDKKPLFEKIKLLLFVLWFWLFWLLLLLFGFIIDVLFLLFIEKWDDSTCILDESDMLI